MTKGSAGAPGGAWLEIDIAEWAKGILPQKGVARILLEPIANALDTSATTISVSLETIDRTAGKRRLTVTDDDPEGFARLQDCWTIGPSIRRSDVTKRGRFGEGEKELLALCFLKRGSACLMTTKGAVTFDPRRGRLESDETTGAGTTLIVEFSYTKREIEQFLAMVKALIVPKPRSTDLNP